MDPYADQEGSFVSFRLISKVFCDIYAEGRTLSKYREKYAKGLREVWTILLINKVVLYHLG